MIKLTFSQTCPRMIKYKIKYTLERPSPKIREEGMGFFNEIGRFFTLLKYASIYSSAWLIKFQQVTHVELGFITTDDHVEIITNIFVISSEYPWV